MANGYGEHGTGSGVGVGGHHRTSRKNVSHARMIVCNAPGLIPLSSPNASIPAIIREACRRRAPREQHRRGQRSSRGRAGQRIGSCSYASIIAAPRPQPAHRHGGHQVTGLTWFGRVRNPKSSPRNSLNTPSENWSIDAATSIAASGGGERQRFGVF